MIREGHQDAAIQVEFEFLLQATHPLTTDSKLANSSFPIPTSFIYSETDFCYKIDGDSYKLIMDSNKNPDSKFHMVPGAGHNLFLENP